jgi:hypothetical protein
MRLRRTAAGLILLVLLLPGLALAEEARHLPFNKQTVYNYFRKVEEAKRTVPVELKPEDYKRRICQLYVDVLKQTGYDFNATVQNAAQYGERSGRRLDDPRFLFLVGVFQYPPDAFVQLGLLSKPVRDAVMAYLAP